MRRYVRRLQASQEVEVELAEERAAERATAEADGANVNRLVALCILVVALGLSFSLGWWWKGLPENQSPPASSVSSASPTVSSEGERHWIAASPPIRGPIVGLEGGWVYPCADPWEISEHLATIGCARPNFETVSALGEDVCLKLWDARTRTEVRALGVRCP